MAYTSIAGGLILAALREMGEPVTFRELLKHIACNIGVQSNDLKDDIQIATQVGVQRGFIQKSGHRFFLKDEFPDEEIKAAVDLVFKRDKEKACQQSLLEKITKGPQEQLSQTEGKTLLEVLAYSDEEDAMVFNIIRPEDKTESKANSNETISSHSNGMGQGDSQSSCLTIESKDSKSISIFDEQKDSKMSQTAESCSEDEQVFLNIK